jgi:hypothetical protein
MWVHFFEPKRKIHHKLWATKESQIHCIAKRTMSVMYVIFFTNQYPAIRIAVSDYLKQEKVAQLPHFPCSKAQKTPCWKKISNAKKSRFGYFL